MIIEHLEGRNYNSDLYQHQTIDVENNILTVQLFDRHFDLVGLHVYNPQGDKEKGTCCAKYSYHVKEGVKAFWGLETLDFSKRELFIVEGMFKAAALHKLGLNAICVFGNSAKAFKSMLTEWNFRLIAICDNDEGGIILGTSVERMNGESWVLDKDVDEYSTIELQSILNKRGISC